MSLLAVTHLASASAWAVYAVGALMALAGAAGVVLQRNPVHCALALVTTIFGIALLFIDEGADFLAAVQIIVYAGAIVILFLFVIMLLGVDRTEARTQERMRAMTPAAVVIGLVAVAELLVLVRVHYWATGSQSSTGALNGPGENVQKLGQSIFTAYLLPFEMTSALLVIAVVAAVVLVRRTSQPAPGSERRAAGPGAARPSAGPTASAPKTAVSPAGGANPPTAGVSAAPGEGARAEGETG
jgi:NADH-quinone oxidoreductase subunit J